MTESSSPEPSHFPGLLPSHFPQPHSSQRAKVTKLGACNDLLWICLPEFAHRAQGKATFSGKETHFQLFLFLRESIITKILMLWVHKQEKFVMKLTLFKLKTDLFKIEIKS